MGNAGGAIKRVAGLLHHVVAVVGYSSALKGNFMKLFKKIQNQKCQLHFLMRTFYLVLQYSWMKSMRFQDCRS